MSNLEALWLLVCLISKAAILFPLRLSYCIIRTCVLAYGRGLPIQQFAFIGAVRAFLTTFSSSEIQSMVPGSAAMLQKLGASHTTHKRLLTTSDLGWLDAEPEAVDRCSKMLLFFHGGGYAVPLSSAHLRWCKRHREIARSAGVNLHVAILTYDLCPRVCYPRQLEQAIDALQHVLNIGFRPRNIIIGGDSAGGNLTFALLAHLLHPHPSLPEIRLSAPLGGAFGISPWLTMDMHTESYRQNEGIDMLSPSLVQQSGREFLPESIGGASDGRNLPMECLDNWWSGLNNCATRVYVNTGKHEMFKDHLVKFAQLLQHSAERHDSVVLDVGELETHDHVLTEFMIGEDGGRAFWSLMWWMLESLRMPERSHVRFEDP